MLIVLYFAKNPSFLIKKFIYGGWRISTFADPYPKCSFCVKTPLIDKTFVVGSLSRIKFYVAF